MSFTQEIFTRLQEIPWLSGGGGFGAVLGYCGLLILSQVLFIPITPVGMVAGFAFGMWPGFAVLIVSKIVSALVNFGLSRSVARGMVTRMIGERPILKAIDQALGKDSVKDAILFRFVPMPFGLANYGFGLTQLSLRPFLVATTVAVVIPAFTLAATGASIRTGLNALNGGAPAGPLWQPALLVVGIAAGIVVGKRITKLAMAARNAPEATRAPEMAP